MTDAIETAREYGRKSAEALHRNRDQVLSLRFAQYHRDLVRTVPNEDKAAVLLAFNEGYRERSAEIIGARPMSR